MKTALAIVLVVSRGFEGPDVGAHGFLAVSESPLRLECGEVGSLFAGVFESCVDGYRDSGELAPNCDFVGRRIRRTSYRTQSTQIDAGTIGAGCWCFAVSSQHHLLVTGMRRFLVDFVQCTGDGFKHRCIRRFCHSRVAILVHVPKLHFGREYSDAPALRSTKIMVLISLTLKRLFCVSRESAL